MSILSTISRLAHEHSDGRARYLTERSIRTLPAGVQRDLGWPAGYQGRQGHHFGVGTWAGGR